MNTTAVAITAIICGTILLAEIPMVFYDYMTERLKSEVRMEDKLKLEIVETLVDICFVLDDVSRYYHRNPRNLRSHVDKLAMLSAQYRKKIIPEEEEKEDGEELHSCS